MLRTPEDCPRPSQQHGQTRGVTDSGGVSDTDHSASCDDPQQVNIDCTGLGGHDLGGCKDYDICIRTDKHGQSIYGPSVTPLESPGRDGTHQVTLVALGGMGCLLGQLPTSEHMGTCRFSAGACPTHVQQVPHCPLSQTVCPSFLDCGNEVDP